MLLHKRDTPMSDSDIITTFKRLSRNPPPTIYLRSFFNDAEILPLRPFIVLYELEPMSGHWILVHDTVDEQGMPCTEFFDSYGILPETEQKYISESHPELYDSRANLLRLLWKETNGRVIFNNHRLQGDTSNTCGRHCIFRLLQGHKSIDKYVDSMIKKCIMLRMSPDIFVSLII